MRHGLDEIILAAHLFRPIRFFRFLSPFYWGNKPPRAVRIRRALEDLGPIYVKFGQIISTRRDLVAPDIADELAKLQDQVPPFPGEEAQAIVEQALGKPVSELFGSFDPLPLASASIAQVHAATLLDGREAVVPEDVQAVLPAVVGHRLRASANGQPEAAGELLIEAVPVP